MNLEKAFPGLKVIKSATASPKNKAYYMTTEITEPFVICSRDSLENNLLDKKYVKEALLAHYELKMFDKTTLEVLFSELGLEDVDL